MFMLNLFFFSKQFQWLNCDFKNNSIQMYFFQLRDSYRKLLQVITLVLWQFFHCIKYQIYLLTTLWGELWNATSASCTWAMLYIYTNRTWCTLYINHLTPISYTYHTHFKSRPCFSANGTVNGLLCNKVILQ